MMPLATSTWKEVRVMRDDHTEAGFRVVLHRFCISQITELSILFSCTEEPGCAFLRGKQHGSIHGSICGRRSGSADRAALSAEASSVWPSMEIQIDVFSRCTA